MSYLLLSSNRSYLKFPIYTIYRHLSTIERSNYDHLIITTAATHKNVRSNSKQKTESIFFTNNYYQKRFITLHAPSVDEKASPTNKNERIPFQFPPGNPNDKPKLEHLRFMEDQLKQIVNVLIDGRLFSSCFLF
jgi:hypothetical protein